MVGEPAPPASCPSLLRDGGGRGDEGDGGLERQQEEGGHPGRQQQQEGSPARPWNQFLAWRASKSNLFFIPGRHTK